VRHNDGSHGPAGLEKGVAMLPCSQGIGRAENAVGCPSINDSIRRRHWWPLRDDESCSRLQIALFQDFHESSQGQVQTEVSKSKRAFPSYHRLLLFL